MNYIIADIFSNFKNACGSNLLKTTIIKNKISLTIVSILYKEGYISNYKIVKNKLEVYFKYINNIPLLKKEKIKIISKPSKRIYFTNKELVNLYSEQGYALHIISTPFGIMSLKNAIQIRQGGEYLFKITI
jgi:ribosomal protein S8